MARDAVGIMLHKGNPVQVLADEQRGDPHVTVTNWKDAVGNDAPITVVNKAEGRSTLEVFLHYFELKSTDVKAQMVIGYNEQGVETVAGKRRRDPDPLRSELSSLLCGDAL